MGRLAKQLVERWRTPDGAALADAVLARLLSGRPLDDLPLGAVEGNWDLRGLVAPQPTPSSRYEYERWFVEDQAGSLRVQNVELSGLDLSGASLVGFRFEGCRIVGCVLDGADCRGWRLWATRVASCSLSGANLRGAAVGTSFDGRARNCWDHVSFAGADFRVEACQSADFVDCDFTMAKIVKVTFAQCRLERCRFSGPISRTVFDGRGIDAARPAPPPMREVDFSGAVLNDVGFKGWDLRGVTMPADPDVIVLRHWPCVLDGALASLAGDTSVNAKVLSAVLQNERHQVRNDGGDVDGVVNVRDIAEYGDADFATFTKDILRSAASGCV